MSIGSIQNISPHQDGRRQVIQIVSTHRGIYKIDCLFYGIKSAPSEFNRIIDQILSGLQGVSSYFDDIIIHGETKEECRQRLINTLEHLQHLQLPCQY